MAREKIYFIFALDTKKADLCYKQLVLNSLSLITNDFNCFLFGY